MSNTPRIVNKQLRLYTDFMHYVYAVRGWQEYNRIFYGLIDLETIQIIVQAEQLIQYINKNGMPIEIQELFNQYILERL